MEAIENKAGFVSSRNACKLCMPLGACLAFKGVEGCVPLLHGSQGCSTYIRRYMISHFKEPVDVASTNFGEMTAIFGGKLNFQLAVENITKQYQPQMIGIASTCLSETIGDDVRMFIHEYLKENAEKELPALVEVKTPSFQGTHMEGFHKTILALIEQLAAPKTTPSDELVLLPGMVSPADIRYWKEILEDFGISHTVLPDYSDTLDGGAWDTYVKIPEGGTPLAKIKNSSNAKCVVELGMVLSSFTSAGQYLEKTHSVKRHNIGMPIGIAATDRFIDILEEEYNTLLPEKHKKERGRLIDSYIDGHKYVFGKKAVLYGEEDLVAGMAEFLLEIGIEPVLCASGGESGKLKGIINKNRKDSEPEVPVFVGVDFEDIADKIKDLKPDIIIGSSKGYYISREIGIPLIRIGFPIHDRIGGQRILHVGYRGAQQLFDQITNALIGYKQDHSSVGYKYM